MFHQQMIRSNVPEKPIKYFSITDILLVPNCATSGFPGILSETPSIFFEKCGTMEHFPTGISAICAKNRRKKNDMPMRFHEIPHRHFLFIDLFIRKNSGQKNFLTASPRRI
jgi:hypothetical protein